MKLLIKNVRLIEPYTQYDAISDVLCDGSIICAVAPGLNCDYDILLDGSGLVCAPGLVDIHSHLRDPGFEYKEDILTGCRSAAAGGITSIACMPNTSPVCDCPEVISYIRSKAEDLAQINVLPIGAVTIGQKGEKLADFAAMRSAGAIAFSDDGVPVMSRDIMRRAMLAADRLGTKVLSHCEDFSFASPSDASKYWKAGNGIPVETDEEAMIARDISLSEETNAPIHICHVSTLNSAELIRRAKKLGLHVTCETAPHYFLLNSKKIEEKGTFAKMNPPLRPERDRLAIIDAVVDGTIDAIITDHAPHSFEEKARDFAKAPNGIVGFETLLSGVLTAFYSTGLMLLPALLAKLTHIPAEIVKTNAGRISIGGRADLVLFDPSEKWTADNEKFLSKSKNSPFGGFEFTGKVKYTISAGNIIYSDGKTSF